MIKAYWEEDKTPIEPFIEAMHEAIGRTIGLLKYIYMDEMAL